MAEAPRVPVLVLVLDAERNQPVLIYCGESCAAWPCPLPPCALSWLLPATTLIPLDWFILALASLACLDPAAPPCSAPPLPTFISLAERSASSVTVVPPGVGSYCAVPLLVPLSSPVTTPIAGRWALPPGWAGCCGFLPPAAGASAP